MTSKHLRIIHLHDLTRLAAAMAQDDWNELLDRRGKSRPLWWAYPPLALAARYCDSIPDYVLCALARRCPVVLAALINRRSFFDLSMSYLWVNAFPGIVWARSIGEAMRYGRNRLIPDKMDATQRACTGRQMRDATLYVVNAALAGGC